MYGDSSHWIISACKKGEESAQTTNHGWSCCAKTCLTSSDSNNPAHPSGAVLVIVSTAAARIDGIAALADRIPAAGGSKCSPSLGLHTPSATMLPPSAICLPRCHRDSIVQTGAARWPRRRDFLGHAPAHPAPHARRSAWVERRQLANRLRQRGFITTPCTDAISHCPLAFAATGDC